MTTQQQTDMAHAIKQKVSDLNALVSAAADLGITVEIIATPLETVSKPVPFLMFEADVRVKL